MPKFRKKPVVIDAWLYGYEGLPMPKWLVEAMEGGAVCYAPLDPTYKGTQETVLSIETLEGVMQARQGDWIIRGVAGEIYPCKPDIFDQTYEAVE